jgi:class 3 adenylate cyclase
MELQSIGLAGLEKAQERLAAAAKKLSGAGLQAYGDLSGAGFGGETAGDTVDLSAAAVALLTARQSAEANLKIVETANELASRTIDILG